MERVHVGLRGRVLLVGGRLTAHLCAGGVRVLCGAQSLVVASEKPRDLLVAEGAQVVVAEEGGLRICALQTEPLAVQRQMWAALPAHRTVSVAAVGGLLFARCDDTLLAFELCTGTAIPCLCALSVSGAELLSCGGDLVAVGRRSASRMRVSLSADRSSVRVEGAGTVHADLGSEVLDSAALGASLFLLTRPAPSLSSLGLGAGFRHALPGTPITDTLALGTAAAPGTGLAGLMRIESLEASAADEPPEQALVEWVGTTRTRHPLAQSGARSLASGEDWLLVGSQNPGTVRVLRRSSDGSSLTVTQEFSLPVSVTAPSSPPPRLGAHAAARCRRAGWPWPRTAGARC